MVHLMFLAIVTLLVLPVMQVYAMQIFVVTEDGTHITVEVEPIDRVGDAKDVLSTRTGFEKELINLIYNNIELENENTLQDYSINKDDTIVMIVTPLAPVPSRTGGLVPKGQAISLSTTSLNSVIYYTTDGTEPTTYSNIYTEEIIIDEPVTIKAVTVVSGFLSDTMTEIFTLSDTTAPVITSGTVVRINETSGAVKFVSDEAGTYNYIITNKDSTELILEESKAGESCIVGENTINNLIGLTSKSMDMYIIVKDEAGNSSNVLKITIPEYKAPRLENLSDQNGTYIIGTQDNLQLIITGTVEEILGVYIDDKLVAQKNYEYDPKTNTITIHSEYLNTLGVGKYTVRVDLGDLIVEASFDVVDNNSNLSTESPSTEILSTENPSSELENGNKEIKTITTVVNDQNSKTNDNTSIILPIFLLVISSVTEVVVLRKKETLR